MIANKRVQLMKTGFIIIFIAMMASLIISALHVMDKINDVYEDNQNIMETNKEHDDQLLLIAMRGEGEATHKIPQWRQPHSMTVELLSYAYTYFFSGLLLLVSSIITTLGRFYTNQWCEKWQTDKNDKIEKQIKG